MADIGAFPHVITPGVLASDKAAAALMQNFEHLAANNRKVFVDGREVQQIQLGDFTIDDLPPNPDPGTLRLVAIDNGAGKAKLIVLDANGVQTVLATET